MAYFSRRRPTYARRGDPAKPEEPRPGSSFTAAFAAGVDAANRRKWARGGTEWNAEEEAIARRVFCRQLRAKGPPFDELADRIEGKFTEPSDGPGK